MNNFLPVSKQDMKERGWQQCDFVYITGDAYVDHSSFGTAIISRVLEANGYKVGIISQPDWKDEKSVTILGEPRLGFLVSAGNMDSMVNHYTVNKKPRSEDAYTPGGLRGKRPDYAVVVYGNLIRKTYKKTPIIIGGIEASLRRLAHYDYWSDKLKRSVLLDSGADIISYGMGEKSIVEIADALNSGISVKDITFVKGTVFKTSDLSVVDMSSAVILPSFTDMQEDKLNYAKSFNIQHNNTDSITGKILIESYPNKVNVVQNPPSDPLTTQEMDDIYTLPFMNTYHPSYEKLGGVPAIKEIKFSLTSNRGCFGGCNFCALTFHQGRRVQVRSHESIIDEAKKMTEDREFKGYIHDVGGPTANFRSPACDKQITKGVCTGKQCLFPKPCPNLKVDHKDYVNLLKKLRNLSGVKKVFVRSGIRFDYVLHDKSHDFLRELCKYHISGQLRVAPEHVDDDVLKLMGKPESSVYDAFLAEYGRVNKLTGKEQYAVPYLMSSHPGSTLKSAIKLAEYIRDLGYMPDQVQDFYPTPSTMSTCMYYTGVNPSDMKPVYIPKDTREKAMQRALIQYRKPENYELVKKALLIAHREDLIGYGKECLIPSRPYSNSGKPKNKNVVSASDRGTANSHKDKKTKTQRKSEQTGKKSKAVRHGNKNRNSR
ncbi:MAG: YgiQ family radical SAM protein [Lachnospiraceae bacterium]|nr:YgiQ family radical SAM protein [Lachnospiraceae bacterium]